MKKLTTEEFINRAKKAHQDTYLYGKTEYKTALHPVTITCRIHGDFTQMPFNHMGGNGCRRCGFVVAEPRRKVTTEQFIAKAKKVHGSTYSYEKFVYIDNNTKSTIICQKHGDFQQAPNPHLHYQGCPTCKTSKGERKIAAILESLGVKFVQQKRFDDCIDLGVLPFDFAILGNNSEVVALVEFQGIHHFKPVRSWGGQENFETITRHDHLKLEYCHKNNIPFFRIHYLDDIIRKINGAIHAINEMGIKGLPVANYPSGVDGNGTEICIDDWVLYRNPNYGKNYMKPSEEQIAGFTKGYVNLKSGKQAFWIDTVLLPKNQSKREQIMFKEMLEWSNTNC